MKKLIYSYILVFSLCFMLLIYEPIIMYATNINDFWFDLKIMIKPVFVFFLLTFLIGCLFFTIIYFVNNKFFQKTKLYYIMLILFSICFFATYIQGNYLIGNLPALDGRSINWSGYLKENIVTLIVWLVIIGISVLMIKKLKIEKSVKIFSYVSLVVCLMLSTSLITTLVNNKAFVSKEGYYATDKSINDISSNKNFLIFMLDAIDEDTFYKEWQNRSEYKDLFDDFTYYTDAMSAYAFTRESVPQILTGYWNKNEEDFSAYATNAYNNSSLFKSLKDNNYKMNMYENYVVWNGEHSYNIENLDHIENAKVKYFKFFKQELRYVLFKYLPYNLKKYSRIDSMDFNLTIKKFTIGDIENYKNLTENKLNKIDSNLFQFYHIEGGHVPFNVDENLNEIPNGTYEQKVSACLKVIKAYLDRLKENNSYDNSVIIIMADHGFDTKDITLNRFNPILMIKGINEKHETIISDLPVSYDDLNNAYNDLLSNKKSTELFENRKKDKKRNFILYEYLYENHMVEYNTTGSAKDISKFKETGNVFDR